MHKPVHWGLVIFIALAMTVAAVSYVTWMWDHTQELDAQEAALTVALSRLRTQSEDLQDQIKDVGSSEYVETIARAEYEFLRDGELRFRFNDEAMLDVYTQQESAILAEELGT